MEQTNHSQDRAAKQWKQFAATGSVFDYLDFKSQQGCYSAAGKDGYADSDGGAGSASGEGGGSGQDTDDSYT